MLFWSIWCPSRQHKTGTTLHLGVFNHQYKKRHYMNCKKILYAAKNCTRKKLRYLPKTDHILQKKKYNKKPSKTQYKIKCFFQKWILSSRCQEILQIKKCRLVVALTKQFILNFIFRILKILSDFINLIIQKSY